VSRGETEAARRVLENLSPLARDAMQLPGASHPVVDQLALALSAQGYRVGCQVGQSRFRVDLAVAKPGEHAWQLAILLDTEAHYGNPDFMERYLLQPSILRAFGWEPMVLLAKDWFADSEQVLNRIKRLMNKVADRSETEPADEPGELQQAAEPSLATSEMPATSTPSVVRSQGESQNTRYFEYVKGASRKFWEITCSDAGFTVRYGRIGSAGQTQTKAYPTPERVRHEADKLVAEKLKKGYLETR
jgi:predicted DNA-binding WGR domain protein